MGSAIFGYLSRLGGAYDGGASPTKVQVLVRMLLTALGLYDIVTYIRDEAYLRYAGWVTYTVFLFLCLTDNGVMISCLCVSLTKRRRLVLTIDRLEATLPTKRSTSWLHGGLALIAVSFVTKAADYSLLKVLTKNIYLFVDELVILVYLAGFVMPVRSLADKVRRLRLSLQGSRGRQDSRLLQDVWRLVRIQVGLEERYSELVAIFRSHLGAIVFAGFYKATTALYYSMGRSVGLIDDCCPDNAFRSVVLSGFQHLAMAVTTFYRIWSVSQATAFAENEIDKFYTDLYTLCLEDETSTLVEHSGITVHLNRRRQGKDPSFFPLGYSLFYSMLSRSATCLFVIIQFRIYYY